MRVRQAAGQGGLVAFVLLASCCAGSQPVPPVDLTDTMTPAELRRKLDVIASRTDYEATIARARIYGRLRAADGPGALNLLSRGDAEDVALLAQPAPPEMKIESARRLAFHFRERAARADLRRSNFPGKPGEPLQKFSLLAFASYYGEYASRADHADALDELGEAADRMAELTILKPDARQRWHARAVAYRVRADDQRADSKPHEATADCRRFCEAGLQRHLEEGTRKADFATREQAARGDAESVMNWYLEALVHFVAARECMAEPTAAQAGALSALELVVRSLADLLCRDP